MKERQETWVRSLGQEDPLEEEMATHSSILAWKTPWTEAPGRLQSMESVGWHEGVRAGRGGGGVRQAVCYGSQLAVKEGSKPMRRVTSGVHS